MKIQKIQEYRKQGKAGVSAQIVMKSGKAYEMFFEVEERFWKSISSDATPFLAAMLPIAMLRKEAIEVEGQISQRFNENLSTIMQISADWNLGLTPVSVKVASTKKDTNRSDHIGGFFSGGADSFYTYLKNKETIDSLIFVHGFDIKMANKDLLLKVERSIAAVADSEHVRLVKVTTNLRDIYDACIDWNLAHGFAVGSVALFLRNGFQSIYVSCGLGAKNKDHYSMTPDLDPLYSGETMQVVHFGCDAEKLQKLQMLSKSKVAMENLRVCWVNRENAYNCSTCEKCLRNMLGLYLCDSLQKCRTFTDSIDLVSLRSIRINQVELKFFTPILEALDKKGDKSDVREALAFVIQKNSTPHISQRAVREIRDIVRAIDSKYNNNRLYWFMANKGFV